MNQLLDFLILFNRSWLVRISTLIIILSIQIVSKGQEDLKFEHYTVEDGLPGVNITWIIQDRQGFIWIGTGIGLSRFDGNSFVNYQHDPTNPFSLSDDKVMFIYEDREGGLWVVTQKGINLYDKRNNRFNRVLDSLLFNVVTNNIIEDTKERFWLSTLGKGLIMYQKETGKYQIFKNDPENTASLRDNSVIWTHVDKKDSNKLWIGTSSGLDMLNLKDWKFHHYKYYPSLGTGIQEGFVTHIIEDDKNNLWISFQNGEGFYKLDKTTMEFKHYRFNDENVLIYMSQLDQNGNIWFTGNSGLFSFNTEKEIFIHYEKEINNPYSIGGDSTFGMCLDNEDNLWIGSNEFGLNKLNLNQNRFSKLRIDEQISSKVIAMQLSDNNLWMLSGNQLFKKNLTTGELKQYSPSCDDSFSFSRFLVTRRGEIWIVNKNKIIRFDPKQEKFDCDFKTNSDDVEKNNSQGIVVIGDIIEDAQNQIWFGTYYDLYKKELEKEVFERQHASFDSLDFLDFPHYLMADKSGNIWIAKGRSGLYQYDPKSEITKHFKHNPTDPQSLSDNYPQTIFEDSKSNLWVTTIKGGLELYNRETGTFELYLKKDLFRPIMTITEDKRGDLWMGTHGQGLIKYNFHNQSLRYFNRPDGLEGQLFPIQKPKLNETTGEIYFKTDAGHIVFDPQKILDYSSAPSVFITTLKTYKKNKKTSEIEEKKNDLVYKDKIVLSHKETNLTFEFAALSFSKPKYNRYAYQLEGFSKDWIQLGSKHEVTFTNLFPGTYTLRVKGSNGDGYWNETPAVLKIIITPPWYWSWPTKILYGLILVSVLYGIYRFQLRRRLAEAETIRLRELDDVKTRLYANITHEFRTPLTVILGMVKNIRTDTQKWLEEGLQMIHRNGQNLLRLVNQMLDLSKLESGAMPVRMIQGDMIAYLKYLTESFHSFAESREVGLHFISDHEELVMDYDPDKTLNIVSNLLSNALKFTPAGGSVYLQVGKQENNDLPVQVRDTGAGIPEEKLPHVFDRFYQADDSATRQGEGTGIGLALTRELVKLLEGRIEVKSRVGQGSVFTVWLPVRHEAPLPGEMPEGKVNLSDIPAGVGQRMDFVPGAQDEGLPLALIVEDNEDVVRYLSGCLEGHFGLSVARDGQEGLEKAEEWVPDIVISDVMMPRKDGFELCDTLKHNWLTSHIPVVLLTAKADAASRISGLRRGADAYLAKPFDEEELLVILENQLELRKTLHARYSSGEFPAKANPRTAEPSTILEDEFILRIRGIIERRLEDYNLDVPQLCQEMATSRTQLHNKLKALTGKSATEYIRWIRVAKARELLLNTDLNISEIAYQCGFQLPHYFTRVFTEAEGGSPTEFRSSKNQ